MPLLKTADFFYSLRFLRLLTTPWKKTGAYKAGIIDEDGKVIKKPNSTTERSVYNTFHKLVFNLKRLLNKVPLGKSTLASYAAALFLIKENTDMSDRAIKLILSEGAGIDISATALIESTGNVWFLNKDGSIQEDTYVLTRELAIPSTGDILALKNTRVIVESHLPVGNIFGISIFEGIHVKTSQKVYFTQGDISR